MNPYKILYGLGALGLGLLSGFVLYSIVNYILVGASTQNPWAIIAGGLLLWFAGGLALVGIIASAIIIGALVFE